MFARVSLAGLFALALAWPAHAADLAAIERVVLKEPAYQGKPRYCLLVFGKEAKSRAWLVLDDKNYYFDRNGNGDLSGPKEKTPLGGNPNYFAISQVAKRDGGHSSNLRVHSHGDGTFEIVYGE